MVSRYKLVTQVVFLFCFFAPFCDLSPSGATWIIQILPAHISYNAVRLREPYAAKHAQQPRTEFSAGASGLYPDPGQGLLRTATLQCTESKSEATCAFAGMSVEADSLLSLTFES